MAHPWKAIVDARETALRITGEPITILGGVALLAEAPGDPSARNEDGSLTYPMTVTVGGTTRTRTTASPAPGQYRVRTWTYSPTGGPEYLPELEFNAADEGLTGTCDYYGTGTIITALRWQAFQAFVDPLVEVLDLATLNAIAPPTTDRDQPGRDGRTARLADGSWWESDGTVWKPWVGGANLNAQRAESPSVMGASQDGAFLPGQFGSDSEGAALGATPDAGFDQPGAFSPATTLGATGDAVQAEVGAPASQAVTGGATQDAAWASGSFTDPFTAANGTNVTADGLGWSVDSDYATGVIKINANGAYNAAPASTVSIYTNGYTPPSANYSVQANIIRKDTSGYIQCGIAARRVPGASGCGYLLALVQNPGDVNVTWQLYYTTGSGTAWTLITSGSVAWTAGTSKLVKLDVNGTTITATIGGTQVFTGTDSHVSSVGKAGINFYSTASNTDPYWATHGFVIDDISIVPL